MDFKSITIYLTCFAICICFTKLAEIQFTKLDSYEQYNIRSKYVARSTAIIFSSIAILVPCIMAAFRHTSVGMDISGYVLPNFNVAFFNNDFFSFYENMSNQTEVLFAFIIYFCAKYFNIEFFFFLIELLIFLPTYIAVLGFRKEISITFSVVLFLFLFYNFSFSGMRQSIAMAFLLLAFSLYNNKEYRKALIIIVVSALFHSSAIFITTIILTIILINRSRHSKQLYLAFTIVLLVFFFFYRNIAMVLCDIVSLISKRYAYYIQHYLHAGLNWHGIHATDMLSKSLIVCVILASVLYFFRNRTVPLNLKTLIVLCLLGRYFTLFSANFYESTRIAYYFDYFIIILVPIAKKCCFKNSISNNIVVNTLLILPLCVYWFYFIMYIGAYGTNKFIFSFE